MEKHIPEAEIDVLNELASQYYAGSGINSDVYDSLEKAEIEYSIIEDNGSEALLKIHNKLVGFRYSAEDPTWDIGNIGFFSAEYFSNDNEFKDDDDIPTEDDGYYESSILNCNSQEELREHLIGK